MHLGPCVATGWRLGSTPLTSWKSTQETHEPHHSQVLQPAFTLPPTAQSPLVHLLIDVFAAFNEFMNEWSSDHSLSMRLDRAGDDREKQENVFAKLTNF